MIEPTKSAFQSTWPGGYTENFVVYEAVTGGKESEIVAACLAPFYNPAGVALEIGCGTGFWIENYLLPNFAIVIGLDVIPREWVKPNADNFRYIEAPSCNYECFGVGGGAVDFVWSFGCFCHLPIPAIEQYLKSTMRVLKPGGKASLFFSNSERRPGVCTKEGVVMDPDQTIIWVDNNWEKTKAMMEAAGFVGVMDLMPSLKDTMVLGTKP